MQPEPRGRSDRVRKQRGKGESEDRDEAQPVEQRDQQGIGSMHHSAEDVPFE